MRAFKTYNTSGVIVAFARQGVPISTIARAIVTPTDHVETVCRRAMRTGELLAMPPAAPAFTRDALALEVASLRETVANLTAQRSEKVDSFVTYLHGPIHFPVSEAKMISALIEHGRMTKERIYYTLYGDVLDPPEPKIIDVFVCKLRKKLRPYDIEIETVWGYGYEMTRENADKLRAEFDIPAIESPPFQVSARDMAVA